jgi:hypothetical protein
MDPIQKDLIKFEIRIFYETQLITYILKYKCYITYKKGAKIRVKTRLEAVLCIKFGRFSKRVTCFMQSNLLQYFKFSINAI